MCQDDTTFINIATPKSHSLAEHVLTMVRNLVEHLGGNSSKLENNAEMRVSIILRGGQLSNFYMRGSTAELGVLLH